MKKVDHIVLLSSAGVGTAYASAKTLRKYYNAEIIAADTNLSYLVTTSLFSNHYKQILPVDNENFGEGIAALISKHNIDTYIPFIDREIYIAAKLVESGKIDKNICLQVKDSNVALICMDKYKAYNWLVSNGFPTPKTYIVKDKSQLRNGNIIKSRTGYGSKIQEIKNDCYVQIENYDDIIMQEYSQLPEITIDVHFSKKYDFFSYSCRERLETRCGVCTKARIFKEPFLGEMALKLAKMLDLSSFCFQVMTLKNEYVITDINPRLGAGTAMSTAVGLDFHGAMFATLWGENPEKFFCEIREDKYVTRQYCEFVM